MTTPNLPQFNPGGQMTHNIVPAFYSSPFVFDWFTQSFVSGIDHEMMGWLTAQGWQVSSVTHDTTTSPPTPRYSLAKQSMNNWTILQGLMNTMTSAFNEGREMNYLRYKDIVTVWNRAFAQSQQHYESMNAKSDADVVVYMAPFTNDLADISTQIGLARSESLAESERVATQLDAYLTKLSDIESNYAGHAKTMRALLTQQSDALEAYLDAYSAKLDALDGEYSTHTGTLDDRLAGMTSDLGTHIAGQLALTSALLSDYTAHADTINGLKTSAQAVLTAYSTQVDTLLTSILTDYNSLSSSIAGLISRIENAFNSHQVSYETILSSLTADFTTHASTARAFLTDLGVTELARINEAFDARLADVAQNLVNRGFYSSPLLNDEQERVERERNQAIVELNDRLAREKLANQHQIFEQQDKMRARSMEGRDRLHGIQQDVLRYQAESAHRLFGQLQSVRERTLAARTAAYGLKDQFTRLQVEIAANLETRLEAVRTRTMESRDRVQTLRDALDRAKLQSESQVFTELSTIRRQQIEQTVQAHATEQEVTRNETVQRDKLLAQLNEAVAGVLDGRAKYSAMSLQKGEYLCNMRVKLNVQLMEIATRRLQAQQSTSQAELELMKYQVDSRNNFLVGMFRVIQDRSDEYPDLAEISKLAFSLGDAGSGWVAP